MRKDGCEKCKGKEKEERRAYKYGSFGLGLKKGEDSGVYCGRKSGSVMGDVFLKIPVEPKTSTQDRRAFTGRHKAFHPPPQKKNSSSKKRAFHVRTKGHLL